MGGVLRIHGVPGRPPNRSAQFGRRSSAAGSDRVAELPRTAAERPRHLHRYPGLRQVEGEIRHLGHHEG